ncbi:HAD family hydrolase [Rhodobacteraceae bacterium RKSG542]|uniref:HAD family hydrolase n=1 Tax=Pseudovibrio flavus TaxID=2529854 RepID=UPI0012BC8BE7|nr:HAD family hydrolase [Pseudovibrio flavus]MTI18185.1 HAD family hydrolase [Pseudovibrio flavus]
MAHSDIKGILFDKDGTLLNFDESWRPALLRASNEAAKGDEKLAAALLHATGYDSETGSVLSGSIIGAGNTQDIARAWDEYGSHLKGDELIMVLDRIFGAAMEDAVPVDGLEQTVKSLFDAGYVLGVASSDSEAAIRIFLKTVGLSEFFSFVVGYDSGYGHKPEPGMLQAFCSDRSLAPHEVVMVGDNPQDMKMGKSAGAGLRVGVLTGNSSEVDLAPLADAVLNDVTHLSTVLNRQSTRTF